jgi:Arc/MetJ-type ribon-helix-helix transcriptional regulator
MCDLRSVFNLLTEIVAQVGAPLILAHTSFRDLLIMGTLSISLSPDVERFVTKKVEFAQYTTKDEVVNAIVQKQMWREWELAWIEKMKAEGQKRLAALEGQL